MRGIVHGISSAIHQYIIIVIGTRFDEIGVLDSRMRLRIDREHASRIAAIDFLVDEELGTVGV